jgi:ribonuclease J
MVNMTNPYYIVPVHGEPRHQFMFQRMAKDMGWPEHRVFAIQNGQTLNIGPKTADYGPEIPWGEQLIDQHGDVAVTGAVLSERAALGSDGVVVVSIGVDLKHGAVTTRPELVTRGFSGPDQVLEDGMEAVCAVLEDLSQQARRSQESIKDSIESAMGKAIHRGCRQRPVVLAIVVPEKN